MSKSIIPTFSSRCFMILFFTFKYFYMIFLFIQRKKMDCFILLYQLSSFPSIIYFLCFFFLEFFLLLLYILHKFLILIRHLSIGLLCTLYSVPLITMYVFVPGQYGFSYYSCVVPFEIRKCDNSIYFILCQDCFDSLGSFVVSNILQDY